MEANASPRCAHSGRTRQAHAESMLQLTVDVGSISAVLRLLRDGFAGLVRADHVQAFDHARRLKLFLCLDAALAPRLIGALVRALPSAEIGHLTHL